MFEYYSPINIGEFTLRCWVQQKQSTPIIRDEPIAIMEFGIAIHEKGEAINPVIDPRFEDFEWANSLINMNSDVAWVDRLFKWDQVLEIIVDMKLVVLYNALLDV